MRFALPAALLLAGAVAAIPAHAACPIELATYGDRDKVAEINFRPHQGGATVTNEFRLLLPNDVFLDGLVQWTAENPRAYGALQYRCPTGDVTGQEYEACTVWTGVIYAVDEAGTVGLIPAQGQPAPKRLIFADVGPSLAIYPAFPDSKPGKWPWDVFELNGCQE